MQKERTLLKRAAPGLMLAALGLATAVVAALTTCSNVSMPELDTTSMYMARVYPPPEHGAIRLSEYSVASGNWITVYVNPDPGYTLKAGALKSFNEDDPDLTGETIQIKGSRYQAQIGKNKRFTAEFERVPAGMYSIHIDSGLANGVIFATPIAAAAGAQVTLTLVPDSGCDLVAGSLRLDNGTALPDTPPYTFTMPAENVEVSAQFESKTAAQLKESAWNYLLVKQYDTAAAFYEESYRQNPADPESIFYASLSHLAGLLVTPEVRSIVGTLHIPTPGTLDDWVCDGYVDGEAWFTRYSGTYTIAVQGQGDFVYEGRDLTLPKMSLGHWGFSPNYSDSDIAHEPLHIQSFRNHLFWGLIASYPQGFNGLLENLKRYVFGKDYEEAAARAASFPAGAKVPLHPTLKARFGLDDYYGAGQTEVGKAELDYIFGTLEAIKALVEYLSVYDWTMDMRNWLMGNITPGDALDSLLQQMFQLADPQSGRLKDLWSDYPTVIKMLPLRNNFLRVKNVAAASRAKAGFTAAAGRLNASLSHWYGEAASAGLSSAVWTDAARTKNRWLKNALNGAGAALAGSGGNGVFYFPNKIPDANEGGQWVWPATGWDWPTAATPDTADVKVYGVDTAKLFSPGVFSPGNVFMTEMAGGEAPQIWQIEWYEDRAANYVPVYTGNKHQVSAPIENRGRQTAVGGTTNNAPYGKFSFMLNTRHLKEVFPRGFERYTALDGSVKQAGDQELLAEIFPHIPLWQWAPSYFGNTITAAQLYYWYHLR